MTRKEVLAEGVELWLGDCLEVLPTLGRLPRSFGVVTDPPYGIGMDGGRIGKAVYEQKNWDSKPIDATWIVDLDMSSIIWGGNYFDVQPPISPLDT